MDYDEIVIGSGLAALGTVSGLSAARRVLVVGGPHAGHSLYYDASQSVPCAHLGYGGLGNYWHGVIATGGRKNFAGSDAADFEQLFRRFYPSTDIASRLGRPFLFVPWRPIRPRDQWPKLVEQRGGRLQMTSETATRFAVDAGGVEVRTGDNVYRGSRVWVCAGALHTPALLDRSLGVAMSRPTVSDHVISYLGQIDRSRHAHVSASQVQRTRDGVWFEARYNNTHTALYTLRPARFAFSQLDYGIEQRSVFGLPTGSALAKILRRASPGLVAEALYNRAGLFPNARVQSVYAQIVVPDAYRFDGVKLESHREAVEAAIRDAHASVPWPEVVPSRRPEIFIPAIHLHHSVSRVALEAAGVNVEKSPVQIPDASVHEDIGPEHHSFKVMLAAATRARALSA